MALVEVARNLVPEPAIDPDRGEPANIWTYADGAAAECGGVNRWGDPMYGLVLHKNKPVWIQLEGVQSNEELNIWVQLDARVGSASTEPLVASLHAQRASSEVHDLQEDNTVSIVIPRFNGDAHLVGTAVVPDLGNSTTAWLRVIPYLTANDERCLVAARVSSAEEGETYGLFDGDTPPAEDGTFFEWTAEAGLSQSVALFDDPNEPEEPGEEEPGATPGQLASRVLAWIDRAGDEEAAAMAQAHVEAVTAYVWGYTRGKGFRTIDGALSAAPDLEHVIIAAAARLTANPTQLTYYSSGDYSERPAQLAGWTLPELAVLNLYRRRWA